MNLAITELKEQKSWLRNYHSKMLQMVGKKVAAARTVLRKKGHKVGRLLRYLSQEEYNSFTYNQSGFKIEKKDDSKELYLSKIGSIKVVLHRQPVDVKQVTVVRQNGKWYAVVACGTLRRNYCMIINYTKPVGIDVGITKFAHASDNHAVENPLFLTKLLRPLRRASRRVSRRQKGSNNYEKAKHMRARLYQSIYNKRRDFLHKLSSYYAQKYDPIFVERLRVQNMVRNHRLARPILDSGWRTFRQMLEYKANRLVEVEPAYTSVICSRCGNKVPKTLAVRTHRCRKWGLVIDRDYNSGLNILQKGLLSSSLSSSSPPLHLLLPVERREVTPVEIPPARRESLKQEEAHVFKRG